ANIDGIELYVRGSCPTCDSSRGSNNQAQGYLRFTTQSTFAPFHDTVDASLDLLLEIRDFFLQDHPRTKLIGRLILFQQGGDQLKQLLDFVMPHGWERTKLLQIDRLDFDLRDGNPELTDVMGNVCRCIGIQASIVRR